MGERIDFLRRHLEQYRYWLRESVFYLSLLAPWRRPPRAKFVIVGQDRSGSTLLAQLLTCNPVVHCEDEILSRRVLWPYSYIRARSMLVPNKAYGFKAKIYQIRNQRIDPQRFLFELHRGGWRIIHIKRDNILRQALSGIVARQRQVWQFRSSDQLAQFKKVHVDRNSLLFQLKRRERSLAEEQEILRDLPHVVVTYEQQLLRGEWHQDTLNTLFDYLGAERVPVHARLFRMSTDRLGDSIENFDEIKEAMSASPYAGFLASEG